MGGPLLKQVRQDNRGPWFTLPAAALQGYQGRSPWLVGPGDPGAPRNDVSRHWSEPRTKERQKKRSFPDFPGFGARDERALYIAAVALEMRSVVKRADESVNMGREPGEGEAPGLVGARSYGMVVQQGVNQGAFDLDRRMRIDKTPDAAIGEGVHAAVAIAATDPETRGGCL